VARAGAARRRRGCVVGPGFLDAEGCAQVQR
jgi:hypothetical protein